MKRKLFYRSAVWAGDRLQAKGTGRDGVIRGLFYRQQQKEMAICERLYGKGQKQERYQAWRIERIRKILLIGAGGLCLALLLFLQGLSADKAVTGLARPSGTAEGKKYALTAEWGEKPLGEILVEIPARQLPDEASELLLDEACRELEAAVLGRNGSLEAVRDDLALPDTLFDGLVTITWESSDFELVDTR